jgi:hypothetical protein
MAAPKGNQFWKKRSSSGRDKIFSSSEELWKACVEYFEYTDSRTWDKIDFKGKDVEKVEIPTSPPYTLSGLFIFLEIDENTWQRYRKEKSYEEFWAIVNQVDRIIYTQKFEGAAVGAYNPMIIARDLGLRDRTDITTDGEKIQSEIDWKQVPTEALASIIAARNRPGGS